jgi:hypothetical protein
LSNPFGSLEELISNLPYDEISFGASSFDSTSQQLALVDNANGTNVLIYDLSANLLNRIIDVPYLFSNSIEKVAYI